MSLTLRNISKHFGATLALDDVSFDVAPGQIHALVGENGAGKSTLMHIAYGMARPDTGSISVPGAGGVARVPSGFATPRAARAAGIGMVHQHFTSIAALTVSENIALTAGWRDTGRAAVHRADEAVRRFGLPLPVTAYVESLSVQLRQRLEIVKALAADATILLLDEPSAMLAPREVAELLRFTRSFADAGGAVVLISHKLDEVLRVADRVTVLRRGVVVLSDAIANQTAPSLARAIIGADLPRLAQRRIDAGTVLVRARNLDLRGSTEAGGRGTITDATFEIRGGEVTGVVAIEGNGQRELLRAIAGVDDIRITAGVLDVTGPVAFVPEDRTTEGTIAAFTLTENLLLGNIAQSGFWLDWPALRASTATALDAHDIRAGGPEVPMATLSGGNQQKFVLARALAGTPRVIVAEHPTRGLDVRATAAIHACLVDAARGGAAVIVHASDLDEVLELADRLLVVARGRVRELSASSPRDAVGDAMLAVESVA